MAIRRFPVTAATGLALAGVLAFLGRGRLLEAIGGSTKGPVREIHLVARDGRFNATNPAVEVAPGERLRLVVRNDDAEAWHDIVIRGLDGQRTRILAPGESAALEFTAPPSGSLAYGCSVHPGFMDGRLVVQRSKS